MDRRKIHWCLAALLLSAFISVILGNGGSRPLDGHEIFVAEAATQMLESGDYVVPEFNGRPRLEKPPLSYWLSAGFHVLLPSTSGVVSEFEARAPSLVAGLVLVWLTFALARVAFRCDGTALLAAALFASSWDFVRYSRSARPEMLYACFCTLLMLGIVLALVQAQRGRSTTRGIVIAAAGLCGALLAKGPHLPVAFLLGTGLALHLRARQLPKTRVLHPGWLLLGALPALLYFAVVAMKVDGAFAVWAHEVVQDKPVPLLLRPLRFYFPAALVRGLSPWGLLPLVAVAVSWRRRGHPVAAVLWMSILVALFALGFSGKLRHHYVLPLVPLASVLSAWACVSLYTESGVDAFSRRWLPRVASAQGFLLLIFLIAVGVVLARPHPVTGAPTLPWLLPWLLAAGVLLVLARSLYRSRGWVGLAVAVAAVMIVWTGVAAVGGDVRGRWVRGRHFALEVARAMGDARVVFVDDADPEPLVYYGRLRTQRRPLERWEEGIDRGEPPWIVCQAGHPEELGIPGDVLVTEPDSRTSTILFRPRPSREPSGQPDAPSGFPP